LFIRGIVRGAKRKTEKSGDDVEYDDEGTRINSVGAHGAALFEAGNRVKNGEKILALSPVYAKTADIFPQFLQEKRRER